MLGRNKNSGNFHTHSELPNYKSECTPQSAPLTVSRQRKIKITAHNPLAYATHKKHVYIINTHTNINT